MSTSVNIFRSSWSSSSSGGGGGGQTIVSAVGKAVYEYDYIDGQWQWCQIQPVGDNIKSFILSNDEEHDFSVTVDGNEPQEDNSNVLFGCFTNRGDTLNGIYFLIEIEDEVFDAEIQVSTRPTE